MVCGPRPSGASPDRRDWRDRRASASSRARRWTLAGSRPTARSGCTVAASHGQSPSLVASPAARRKPAAQRDEPAMIGHRRRSWVAALGLAILIAVAAIAASTSRGGRAATVHAAKPQRPSATGPPRPRVTTLGATRSASLVSYCWNRPTSHGGSTGVCADGIPGRPAHTLDWRPGAPVAIDLSSPPSDVQIQLARFTRFGRQIAAMIVLPGHRDDHVGRRWTVTIPATARRSTDLLISAHFARGDIYADLGLRRS
jgi:hypothetical protein